MPADGRERRSTAGQTPQRFVEEPPSSPSEPNVPSASRSPVKKKRNIGKGPASASKAPGAPSPPSPPPRALSPPSDKESPAAGDHVLPDIQPAMLMHCLDKRHIVALQVASGCHTKTGTQLKRVQRLWVHCGETSSVIWDHIRSITTVQGNPQDLIRDITERLSAPGAAKIAEGHELARVTLAQATAAAKSNKVEVNRKHRDQFLRILVSQVAAGARSSSSCAAPAVMFQQTSRVLDQQIRVQDDERLTSWGLQVATPDTMQAMDAEPEVEVVEEDVLLGDAGSEGEVEVGSGGEGGVE